LGAVKGDAADEVSATWTKHIHLPHASDNLIILRLCESAGGLKGTIFMAAAKQAAIIMRQLQHGRISCGPGSCGAQLYSEHFSPLHRQSCNLQPRNLQPRKTRSELD
jgi:hypothetical protein